MNRPQQLDLAAAYAPPMENGEVIFEAPWQGRCFGMAVSLVEQGHFTWADVQRLLIEVIGEWDVAHPEAAADRAQSADYAYFELFSEALTRLLLARGLIDAPELLAREQALAALPHDHDHQH